MIPLISLSDGLIGVAMIMAAFLLLFFTFELFGGYSKKEKRGRWFHLWYIVPTAILLSILFYFLFK